MILFLILGAHAHASASGCNQAVLEGSAPPTTSAMIVPRSAVQPFYEWYQNNGYCGEVSLIQAGLSNGQWTSQYNARLLCGSGLSQSGPDGFCLSHFSSNYNAQLLIEDPVAGDSPYDNSAQCLANYRLQAQTYEKASQPPGLEGYRQYMSWIKGQLIAGGTVAITVLHKGHSNPEYDHIVTVSAVGTNHSQWDANYYDDDVLYFEDHGSLSIVNAQLSHQHPAIPLGATHSDGDCNPYLFGYTFASLAQTREGANASGAQLYSIIIPGVYPTMTQTGGDGSNANPNPITGGNYAFSVSGVMDEQKVTLPVTLTLLRSSTDGTANPADPIAGLNYENPFASSYCTNSPPPSSMDITLQATMTALTPGKAYRLYEYDFDAITGVGDAAALAVPTKDFNANAGLATRATTFTASTTSYSQTIQTPSNKTVVVRCVPADAP